MTRRNPDFSKRLAGEIARNGWSKRDFARKVGIHENSINKYTLHGGVPKWDTLVSMARELDCSVEWLLSGIDHRIESGADLPTPPVSFPKIRRIGEERRSTHKLAGVKAPDAQILAAWFARDPEARDILLSWARARASAGSRMTSRKRWKFRQRPWPSMCSGNMPPRRSWTERLRFVGEWGPNNQGIKS